MLVVSYLQAGINVLVPFYDFKEAIKGLKEQLNDILRSISTNKRIAITFAGPISIVIRNHNGVYSVGYLSMLEEGYVVEARVEPLEAGHIYELLANTLTYLEYAPQDTFTVPVKISYQRTKPSYII